MSEQLSIVVTGGAGYLGSILVPALLARGHKVTVVETFMFREAGLFDVCAEPNFNVIRGDARDEALMTRITAGADLVIPLAALVGAPLCDRDRIGAVTTNRDAVLMLTRILSPEQRMIIPNTNSGYGIGKPGIACTEDTPLNPISLYGRAKVEAELAVLERKNSISLRLATVFGMAPRMRVDLLVNDFVHRAVTDRAVVLFEADFMRNYIHIRDVTRAFLHAVDNFNTMRGSPYNVGLSDANLSKRQLCALIQKQVPGFVYLEAPVGEDPDKRDYIVSNARIEATGFKPVHSLESGITELVKGYTILRNSRYANV
ncbi:putative NAD-dependent epimerase/dehydratase(UDP-glucose 4-epimerase) [Magnetospirillum gryphiswaldense MSR-1 v2]|uniref:NAD-dependent epimerase/dehydratase(UDP-glucose 4-epimerase) n=1 Tax=Magnetospirillum gryphiswaldense (strain DSM 6361 / JCM 21280 / NBRC 15271 / MSR-1) TaxID=431944 RepID=V6F799_MAGGM|nr:NAD(P)-dependent oxidoreductase [Magnetospirillum gryphiswaldense]CDL01390.1 putative NAD-dependent epimerase/dehydratase(UDP-glucose 4-epimerase) [Magnetospirillum gryphiswaldense MSR-1 v2]